MTAKEQDSASSPTEHLTVFKNYAGFLENNVRFHTAAQAIEIFARETHLAPQQQQRLMDIYIWQENPSHVKTLATVTGRSVEVTQGTIFEAIPDLADTFEVIERKRKQIEVPMETFSNFLRQRLLEHYKQDPLRKQIISLTMDHKRPHQVAGELGIPVTKISYFLNTIRKFAEDEYIYDHGYVRLTVGKNKNAIKKAAKAKRIPAMLLLNIYYGRQEDIDEYMKRFGRKVDTSLGKEGLYPVTSFFRIRSRQYNMLQDHYSFLCEKKGNRLYISHENVQVFHQLYEADPFVKEQPHIEDSIPLATLTIPDSPEYRYLIAYRRDLVGKIGKRNVVARENLQAVKLLLTELEEKKGNK